MAAPENARPDMFIRLDPGSGIIVDWSSQDDDSGDC
jgi:hypothetical protein